MKQLFNAITCNEPKRLIKPVFWNALANLSNLLPFLCLAYMSHGFLRILPAN